MASLLNIVQTSQCLTIAKDSNFKYPEMGPRWVNLKVISEYIHQLSIIHVIFVSACDESLSIFDAESGQRPNIISFQIIIRNIYSQLTQNHEIKGLRIQLIQLNFSFRWIQQKKEKNQRHFMKMVFIHCIESDIHIWFIIIIRIRISRKHSNVLISTLCE